MIRPLELGGDTLEKIHTCGNKHNFTDRDTTGNAIYKRIVKFINVEVYQPSEIHEYNIAFKYEIQTDSTLSLQEV